MLVAGYAFLLAMPLFVDLRAHSFTLTNLFSTADMDTVATSGSTRVHLAFAATALLAGLALLTQERSFPHRWAPRVVLALGAWFTLSAVYGMANGGRLADAVFYTQTLVPLLAWFLGYRLEVREDWVARGVMAAYCLTDLIVLGFTLANGGLGNAFDSSTQLENAIPQYRSYFPAVMALAVALAIAHVGRRTWLPIATLVLVEITLPFLWSRGGILMVVVAAVATAACRFGPRLSWRGRAWATAAGGALLAFNAFITLSVGLVSQRTQESNLAASDTNRVQLARGATDRIGANPIFGDAFHSYSSVLAGGRKASFARIFPAHNQYLDFGLRGGAPAVLLLVALLLLTIAAAVRILRAGTANVAPVGWAGLGFVVALGLGCLTELYVAETWTGSLALFYFGLVARTAADSPATPGHQQISPPESRPMRDGERLSTG